MSPMDSGIIGVIVGVLFLAIGIPVGIALMCGGFLGLLALFGWNFTQALMVLGSSPYFTAACFELTVIPLFILMGIFAMYTGSSQAAYSATHKLLGRIPGSVGIATLFAAALFGASCGSSIAVSAIFTKVSLPEMLKRGYDKSLATGLIVAGGLLGMLIPPSTVALIYGVLTGESIGKLFLGGFMPGVFYTLTFSFLVVLIAYFRKDMAPLVDEKFSIKEKLIALKDYWSMLLLGIIVMGGIYTGIFTPTEAGAIGAMTAFTLFLVFGKLNWKHFRNSLFDAAQTTTMIFLVIIGASIFARMLCLSGITAYVTETIANSDFSPTIIFILFLIVYLIMGCFLDSISMMCITLPVVYPLMKSFGFDTIWSATIIIIVMEMGLLTPPMGLNVYVVKATANGVVTLVEVFKGAAYFLPILVLGLVLFFFFPEIITWLPSKMIVK